MPVDVMNTVVINRPIADVFQHAVEPDDAPLWYENITSVEWKTPRPLRTGSRIDFVALPMDLALLKRRLDGNTHPPDR